MQLVRLVVLTLTVLSNTAIAQEPSEKLIASLDQSSTLQAVDVWQEIGAPCTYQIDGQRYSYFSTSVDIGFGVTPFNKGISVERRKLKTLLKAMLDKGCDINYRHPYTGHLPIHSGVLFYRKNEELTKFLILSGADLNAKTPTSDELFPNMSSLQILKGLIEKYPPQAEREKLLEFIKKTVEER
ncbi:hypothetical protein ACFSJ3_03140 [Corallincola platygyrae]|uniref:Ankyrin repeat domain-containing protein n=1 Tax=Corallincola platygyrae TaxID=1193278 RepID=A0ABW4XL35_9GAMM